MGNSARSTRVRLPLSLKITFPYVILAVLFSLAASYIVTTLVFENIETRFRNQLLSASQISADLMVEKENDLLATLRAIAFTEGVADNLAATNSEALRRLILPLAVNNRIEAIEVIGTDGISVLSLHHQTGGGIDEYISNKGANIYQEWGFADKTLQQFIDINNDALSNKFAGWATAPWGTYFYVSGPVYTDSQEFVGIVLVGASIDMLAAEFEREVSVEAITFYDSNGQLIHSSLSLFTPDTVTISPDTVFSINLGVEKGRLRPLSAGSVEFTEVIGPWQSRNGERIGVLGVARATNIALSTGQVSRVLVSSIIALLFILVIALGLHISRLITRPIQSVITGIHLVDKGNFDVKIPADSNDEIAVLANAFNEMVGGLKHAEVLRNLLNLYVSPEVARAAVESGTRLEGRVVQGSVLFSDIRGFTTLSEQMTPDDLMRLLNRYMSVMVDVIVMNGGMVNKFGGDSLLAVFGTPLNPLPNHAARAVQTALDMRAALEKFNREQDIQNVPPLKIGIGIATGLVVAGNIGGEERIEYTVIGDTVNLASRLQNMTKEFKYDILINDTTHESAAGAIGYDSIKMTAIEVRGKQTRVDIYAVR
jgi:adenylate cyclase